MVFLFFSLSLTFTSILFNSIRYFWLPSVGNSIQNYRLLFSLFGFIHSLILISNLKKSDPKGKKEKKNNSSVLGMSYAYLFKYIIIGDTGTPPSLSLSLKFEFGFCFLNSDLNNQSHRITSLLIFSQFSLFNFIQSPTLIGFLIL